MQVQRKIGKTVNSCILLNILYLLNFLISRTEKTGFK